MSEHRFHERELATYRQDGFLVVPALFEAGVIEVIRRFAGRDASLRQAAYDRLDGEGRSTRLALWNDPPEAPYGLIARSRQVVCRMEQLLGGEVYHWHSKMTLKEPHVGGAWEWHQDYGYWYHNGCLSPLLASCMIALDRADTSNGGLQVVRGSHEMGRVDHGRVGDQTGADQERIEAALARFERVDVELDPGDAVFFHCNLLHCSDANRSSHPRWTMVCCYNAARNDPYKDSRHPRYTRLEVVADSALADWARQNAAAMTEADGSTESLVHRTGGGSEGSNGPGP